MADQRFLSRSRKQWRNILLMPLFFVFVLLSGCATPTTSATFRVLDAETKQPIEGAVALAHWIGYKGIPGFYHGYTAGVVEDVSDSEGKLTISRDSGLGTPHLKVYKPGYVGWDSRFIYLGYYENDIQIPRLIKRQSFSMKDQDILLEPWKDGKYNYISHGSFIEDNVMFSDIGMSTQNSVYRKAIEHEIPFRRRERRNVD
ncbi:MAG: hypothetical protein D3908_06280 [Candidatus Electrothrix sp. AUS4]|nr:hypothetical protein [Candidatus Electrothrix sp. AUS4]